MPAATSAASAPAAMAMPPQAEPDTGVDEPARAVRKSSPYCCLKI
ncbi:hypothetical protein [Serratia marcescens]|nr:hypothetical protein [Serratia marcescens]